MRGREGTFRSCIAGIQALCAERKRQASSNLAIFASTTLLPRAVSELPNLLRQLKDHGVDHVFVAKLQHISKEQGEKHEQVFRELFQITPVSWKGFPRLQEAGSSERVKTVVEELRNHPEFVGFVRWETPAWNSMDFARYYQNPASAAPNNRACRFPWDAVSLHPNGDVSPCPDFPDFIAGNVNESAFGEIWNGDRFADFRKKLAAHGRFPVCTSCCHLYEE
jgi:radical SAM protein with 4Fe4S-binding SPASM domain